MPTPINPLQRFFLQYMTGGQAVPGKDQSALPKDPSAPESPSRVVLEPDGIPFDPVPAPQEQTPLEDGAQPVGPGMEYSPAYPDWGQMLAPPRPTQPTPRRMVSNADAMRTLMLQTGLNLMVPQWGGPLAQVAQAFGGGAEAVGRQQAALDEQSAIERETVKDNEQTEAIRALTQQRAQAAETSRSKRMGTTAAKKGSTTEFERLAAELGLGPKGKVTLKAGWKSLEDPLLSQEERSLLQEALIAEALEADAGGESAATAATPGAPAIGTIRKGTDGDFKFLGGDPKKKSSWEKVN